MNKLRKWLERARIGVAVGRVVVTGRQPKTFDKIERGVEIAERAAEIYDLIRQKPARK